MVFVAGDAAATRLTQKFDHAVCLCEGALSLLEPGMDPVSYHAGILANVHDMLDPGGVFLLTALNGYRLAHEHTDQDVASGHFDPIALAHRKQMTTVRGATVTVVKKSFMPLELEVLLQAAQRQHVRDESDYVLAGQGPSRLVMRLYYALPQGLRLPLLRCLLANPHRSKAMMGTAMVTSVGTVGHLAAWTIPRAMHSLCFALGSTLKKPWVTSNRVEIRDILHLTVLFDHDVVDGVPAANAAVGSD